MQFSRARHFIHTDLPAWGSLGGGAGGRLAEGMFTLTRLRGRHTPLAERRCRRFPARGVGTRQTDQEAVRRPKGHRRKEIQDRSPVLETTAQSRLVQPHRFPSSIGGRGRVWKRHYPTTPANWVGEGLVESERRQIAIGLPKCTTEVGPLEANGEGSEFRPNLRQRKD